MDVGERIKSILDAQHMSQKDLSEATGISQSLLSKYLSNSLSMRSDVLCQIAKALGVSVSALIDEDDKKESAYGDCLDILSREGLPLSEKEKMDLIKIILEHE